MTCAGGGVQRSLSPAQVTAPDVHKSAGRRQGPLPPALAAMEAALRRVPDALGAPDRHVVLARQARVSPVHELCAQGCALAAACAAARAPR